MNTTNPLPGAGVQLTLDRQRTLRLPFNSLVALGKATGQNPLKGEFWSNFDDPERIRVTLWACLLHEDPKLTIEQAGELVTMDRLGEIASAIADTIHATMPAKKTAPEEAAA
jgi:hypothetical protein